MEAKEESGGSCECCQCILHNNKEISSITPILEVATTRTTFFLARICHTFVKFSWFLFTAELKCNALPKENALPR